MSASQADSDPLIQELESLLDAGVVSDDLTAHDDASRSPPTSAELGALLPRYRLAGQIGAGGMGQVYDARDMLLNRRVAIKVVARTGPVVADLMRREREVLAALEHPGIVAVYDCGELPQGHPYYVMQYVEGEELRDYVARRRLSLPEKLRLVAEIARSVGVAHLLKVVHRDLKPSNIKVTGAGRPKILDFGLAKFTATRDLDDTETCDERSFQTVVRGRVKGTLAYMSPEQAAGEAVDSRSDTYALGVLLYELLLGRLPHNPESQGSTPLDWSHRLRSDPVPLDASSARELPSAIRAILSRALDPKATRRYPTGIELADDLEAYLENRPVSAVRNLRSAHLARSFVARHTKAIALAGLVVAVLAAIIVASFLRIREERNLAEQNARRATAERRRAVDRENATRRFLYAADMGQAHRLWQNQQVDRAQALLDRYLPAAGQDDLRTFEWRFLQKLCQNHPQNLAGHAANLAHIQYSPDGRQLASADEGGTIRIWDAESGKLLSTLSANTSAIKKLGYFADGKTLFSIGADRALRLWDLESRRQRRSFWWFWSNLSDAACSPDGRRMAVADAGGWVYLWDTQRGQVLGQIAAHPGRGVRSVVFSPDGTRIATGGKDQTARVWDAATRAEIAVLQPHLGPIDAVCFSPDGRRLATGGVDRTLRVWQIADPAKPEFVWSGGDEIVGVGFGRQAERVWAACKNGTLNYLSTAGAERSTVHTDTAHLRSASVTADLARIASTAGDRTIQLWREQQLVEFRHIQGDSHLCPTRLALSPSGELLAVIYLNKPHVDVWHTDTRTRAARLAPSGHTVTAIAFSADGNSLLSTDVAGSATVWEVGTWRPTALGVPDSVYRSAIAVSSRDGRIAVGDAAGKLVIWEPQTHSLVAGLKGHDSMPIVDLAFTPDGSWLASAGWDKTIHLWDMQEAKLAHVLRGHQGIVYCVRFSPDGSRLASTGADGTVRLWNRETGTELTTLWRQPYETYGVCFTPDGRTLAASSADPAANGSAEVRMWNLETLQETLALKVSGCRITGLCFSPGGDRLYAGVGPGPTGAGVLIWEADEDPASPTERHLR